jgi:hypothetical protein
MPPAGFESAISVGERPQTLDRSATGIGNIMRYLRKCTRPGDLATCCSGGAINVTFITFGFPKDKLFIA